MEFLFLSRPHIVWARTIMVLSHPWLKFYPSYKNITFKNDEDFIEMGSVTELQYHEQHPINKFSINNLLIKIFFWIVISLWIFKSVLQKLIMIALFIKPRYFNELIRFWYSIYILVESVNSTVHDNFCLFEYGNPRNVQQKLLPVG